jgi:hypothetical protein
LEASALYGKGRNWVPKDLPNLSFDYGRNFRNIFWDCSLSMKLVFPVYCKPIGVEYFVRQGL